MTASNEVSPREAAVLVALYGKELYGLEIPKAVEESSGGTIKMRLDTLYPVLCNLVSKGLIKARWGEEVYPERGGARRYSLTGNGSAKLRSLQSTDGDSFDWQPA